MIWVRKELQKVGKLITERRERKRDRRREKVEAHSGDFTVRTLSQNHWLGKEGLSTIRFYESEYANSEILEVQAIACFMTG